jgi:hypothetical protein
MNTNRKPAVIVGVLFIIGTVSGILSGVIASPVLNAPDFLVRASVDQNQFLAGALLVLTMGLALALVPVVMFPIFRKQNETLALGYVIFRSGLEMFVYIAMVISWLLLVVLSQIYVDAGAPDAAYFQDMGALILNAGVPLNQVLHIIFSLGALMFNALWYQSRLIPRWLSGWGFIAAILYLSVGLSGFFGLDVEFLVFPMALQEMVMAVWLIAKGFNPSASAFSPVVPEYAE